MIIWNATIGHTDLERDSLPGGSNLRLRHAVEQAFTMLTGLEPNIMFTGMGPKHLDEAHLAVVEHRNLLDDPSHHAAWERARTLVEMFVLHAAEMFDGDDQRQSAAVSALCELIWYRNKEKTS